MISRHARLSALQAEFHQPPYRFRSRDRVGLVIDPGIKGGELIGLETHAKKRPLTRGRRSFALLCYHGTLRVHD